MTRRRIGRCFNFRDFAQLAKLLISAIALMHPQICETLQRMFLDWGVARSLFRIDVSRQHDPKEACPAPIRGLVLGPGVGEDSVSENILLS